MTDSGSINWKKPIKSKSQTDYNAVHQKMFAEISKESEYPFWSGVVSSAKVEQIADFHSSLGTAIARTIGTYAASYAGEKLAEKVAPKVLAKLGLKASGKTISIGIVVGSLCYDIYKTIKNYNELPSGDYNQFVISVEGYYDDFVVGIGICTYYYEHTLTIVEKTVGKNTTYIISSEAYYSWRE